MKLYKTILPAVASVMLLTGCDDQIMEWFTPEGHGNVTKAELPLQVKEVLANYDNIKDYAAQYMPNTLIGLGVGLVTGLIPALHMDKILIGDIMLLIPGLAMTNSIRNMLGGNTISGLIRLTESLIWAGALAGGFMTAIMIIDFVL